MYNETRHLSNIEVVDIIHQVVESFLIHRRHPWPHKVFKEIVNLLHLKENFLTNIKAYTFMLVPNYMLLWMYVCTEIFLEIKQFFFGSYSRVFIFSNKRFGPVLNSNGMWFVLVVSLTQWRFISPNQIKSIKPENYSFNKWYFQK